ncbi:MAG TPA: hypothetical protein VF796_07255 [Humisphaera sp.]
MSDFQLFPTTHWSLVARAGEDPSAAQRDALGELLKRYLPAFRTYLMTKYRFPADQADDVAAGFVASRLVEQNLIGKADADRGKFRNFLMTALERYAIDQQRQDRAAKRGGGRDQDNVMDVGERASGRPGEDPAEAFDASWAREVIRTAVERMRAQTEQTRPDLWGVFADRVLGPTFDGTEPTAHAELVRRLGFKDEGQAANALQTAKRIFARTIRGVVAEYATTADEVDAEVGELMAALGR